MVQKHIVKVINPGATFVLPVTKVSLKVQLNLNEQGVFFVCVFKRNQPAERTKDGCQALLELSGHEPRALLQVRARTQKLNS